MDDASLHLVARWRAGDQQAATELFHRYAERLIALAHKQLPARMAARVDAEDVVQSVYLSFFAAARQGRYALERSGDLWRLLLAITLHKVQHEYRQHTADKRSFDLELTLPDDNSCYGLSAAALANEPTPYEAVALNDLLDQSLHQFDPEQRRMVELRLQGYALDEIAKETSRSLRTVCRVLDRFKEVLNAQDLDAPSSPPPSSDA